MECTVSELLAQITNKPMTFLKEGEVICLVEPAKALYGRAKVRSLSDEVANQEMMAVTAAYISKIVVARTELGVNVFIDSTAPVHKTVIQSLAGSIDPTRLEFGGREHIKAEFSTPPAVHHGYLITPHGEVLYLNGESALVNGKKANVSVQSWDFIQEARRMRVAAVSGDGSVYDVSGVEDALAHEDTSMLDFAPKKKREDCIVNAYLTIPTKGIISLEATTGGLFANGKIVQGTHNMSIWSVSYAAEMNCLYVYTRAGKVHRLWIEAGEVSPPDRESVLPAIYTNTAAKILAGPKLPEDSVLMTAWSSPQGGGWLYQRQTIALARPQAPASQPQPN